MNESNLSIKTGSKIEVPITDLSSEGFGVGRIDGIAVFIEGALSGETVIATITGVKKNYLTAKLEEIIISSSNRQEPFCPVFENCGGCTLQHMSYGLQLEYKEKKVKDAIERISGLKKVRINNVIVTGEDRGYRNKAQFFFGYKNNEVNCGFFGRKSHIVINNDYCFLISGTANKLKNEIVSFIKTNISEFYDSKRKSLILKSMIIRQSFKVQELMLVFIVSRKMDKKLSELFLRLISNLTGKFQDLKSVFYSVNADPESFIINNKIMHFKGSNSIIESVGGLRFKISPGSFFQVNTLGAERLYSKIAELADLKINETALDLFCGTGTIGLFLAHLGAKVCGIDIVKSSIEDARENAKMNKIKNIEFIKGDAAKLLEGHICDNFNSALSKFASKIDVITVDPPREGLGDRLVNLISKLNAKKIIYISCNAATLARDLKYFDILGYEIIEINPIDMFPQTEHVECVVWMTKANLN
ncbi:MAG: 23S rRNA (uracil(1939)-C(5))-methyltransferase RlmD [Candidatus Humimicrobiaceae bacterium]